MKTIDEIYSDLCLKGKYEEKYEWKQRGRFAEGDRNSIYKGGSLDICEYLSNQMRKNGYETYIVFTKRDHKFLHAAVVYKNSEGIEYYIADPTTDLKAFAEKGLNNVFVNSMYLSDTDKERVKLLKQSKNQKRNIDEFIEEFGPITLDNILLEEQLEYFSDAGELKDGIKRARHFNYDGFNRYGLNRNGTYYNNEGYNNDGYNYKGINRRGFNKEGLHYKTNKPYDEKGLNKSGRFDYDEDGYNICGFNRYQRHRNGTYYDDEGYDYRRINKKGFNKEGTHYRTGALFDERGYRENGEYYYDEEGYDYRGFNESGRDRDGYDRNGFNEEGIHRKGTKYDENGRDRDGYDKEGYDRLGFDKQGYNKKGYNQYGVNREGINIDTGKIDDRIVLVQEFVDSNTSKQMYCKQKNINLNEFNKLLKEIFSIYPNIDITKDDIDREAKKSSAIYLAKREKIANGLISGEITFDEYCKNNKGIKFEDLLSELQGTEGEVKLYRLFGEAFTSKKLDMMDYINIFEKGKYDNTVYKRTMQKFMDFEKECLKHKELLEIYRKLKKEETRLGKYKKQFKKDECQKIGCINKETGEIDFIEITDEHMQYAKQYLYDNGKYICSSNMQEVFEMLARKELKFEDIRKSEPLVEHTSQEILEGISAREGNIEEILNETLLEQDREKEEEQTQSDN